MTELSFQTKQKKFADGSLVVIVKVLGIIEDGTECQLKDKILSLFNQGIRHLVLDFSEIQRFSSGMGMLLKLADTFEEAGGDIKLVSVPERIIALFDALGVLSLFKVYETVDDAIY